MIHVENTIPLVKIVEQFSLETLYVPDDFEQIFISEDDINRPGLPLVGFFEYFDRERIQILGLLETTLMARYEPEKRRESFERLFRERIPVLIITRNIEPFPECMEMARHYKVPVLRTGITTSSFISSINFYLKMMLAEKQTIHGTLVDVYGEGILLRGESGIGKSETAIELVKRGHRLVADDSIEIKKLSEATIVGSAPEITRYYIEVRGIGIIDMRRLFGIGAVKISESIDYVIDLENLKPNTMYDRLGIERMDEFEHIMGVKIPKTTIPVTPGRNLAVMVEVAAMNFRMKQMGLNSAYDLSNKLYQTMVDNGTELG